MTGLIHTFILFLVVVVECGRLWGFLVEGIFGTFVSGLSDLGDRRPRGVKRGVGVVQRVLVVLEW